MICQQPSSKRNTRHANLAALVLLALCLGGCTRAYYRHQADGQAYHLLYEKAAQLGPDVAAYAVEPDPASRMYNPFCPDHQPMPPDDPLAHNYMHWVDCKEGWHGWHANGDTPYVESPLWHSCLLTDEEGCLVLSGDDAVRLARLHSRDYQSQLETLYLSALDVSEQRFAFDTQLFGGLRSEFAVDGDDSPGGSNSTLTVGTLPSSRFRKEKLFASGGQLIVGLANTIMWEFAGPDMQSASTIIDFMFTQPLLQGAGREVVLEALTVAERSLLSNVRQMERFRRGFYVEVFAGPDAGNGPSRITGVGGGLTLGNLGPGGSVNGGQASGYLGLLQTVQNIRNQEFNVRELQKSVLLFEALIDNGRNINALQVEQLRQALFNAQSALLNARADYQNSLDSYKLQLGLPPQQCVKIEDPLLEPFRLIDPEVVSALNEVDELKLSIGGQLNQVLIKVTATTDVRGEERKTIRDRLAGGSSEPSLCDLMYRWIETAEPEARPPIVREIVTPWSDEVDASLAKLTDGLETLEAVPKGFVENQLPQAVRDVEALLEVHPERREEFAEILDLIQQEFGLDQEITNAYLAEFDRLPKRLPEQLTKSGQALREYSQRLPLLRREVAAMRTLGADRGGLTETDMQILICLADTMRSLGNQVLDVMILQAEARAESITLAEVDLDAKTAIGIASVYRRDWQNARSALVDTWRQIEFVADDLESRLDVVFEGDIRNVGDNPFNLQPSAGRLAARLEWDTPLTRLVERNDYREQLINYDRTRRDFYAFRDGVSLGLRSTLRLIERNKLNFELQRRAIMVAIRQVDLARERLDEPRRPDSGTGPGGGVSDTAARDLTSALADLLNAQNAFLNVWVNYEVLRRILDRDLGTMQIDPDGVWIDPGPITAEAGFVVGPHECQGDLLLEEQLLGPIISADNSQDASENLPRNLPATAGVQSEVPGEARTRLAAPIEPFGRILLRR